VYARPAIPLLHVVEPVVADSLRPGNRFLLDVRVVVLVWGRPRLSSMPLAEQNSMRSSFEELVAIVDVQCGLAEKEAGDASSHRLEHRLLALWSSRGRSHSAGAEVSRRQGVEPAPGCPRPL